MAVSIVPSNTVPLSSRLVNGGPRPLVTNSNPQTANPPFPILLADSILVPSSGENTFRSENYKNNLGRPIELRALRVFIQLNGTTWNLARGGGVIALSILIDGVPMTHGFVPVWHLCRSDNRFPEGGPLVPKSTTYYTWFFSRPVPLRPGKSLEVAARHLGGVPQNPNALVSVAFAGRVSPAPIANWIPYASHWTSQAFTYAQAGTDSAPPSSLVNDTGRDMVVDRIIGRAIANDDASLGAGNFELADFNDVSLQGVTSFLVRLGLSQQRPILKTYTPWRAVFGQNSALETDFVLKAGDYLTADVQHIAGPALGAAFTFSQSRGSISIVGSREV